MSTTAIGQILQPAFVDAAQTFGFLAGGVWLIVKGLIALQEWHHGQIKVHTDPLREALDANTKRQDEHDDYHKELESEMFGLIRKMSDTVTRIDERSKK